MCQYGQKDKPNKGHACGQGGTNRWLATQLGKDPATVSKWCTNAAQPTIETMMQIAKLLNVEMNDLVRFEALPDIPSLEENVTTIEKIRHNSNNEKTP